MIDEYNISNKQINWKVLDSLFRDPVRVKERLEKIMTILDIRLSRMDLTPYFQKNSYKK